MTYHDQQFLRTGAPGATLADVVAWAKLTGESYDAICELRKAPARLGLTDDDLALVPADIEYFERTIALSSYAAVSRSRDIEAARRRGNARLRALLMRFREAHSPREHASDDGVREDWDQLISWIDERSSPPRRGGASTSARRDRSTSCAAAPAARRATSHKTTSSASRAT